MENLHKRYDELQAVYGDPSLDGIYGAGKETQPDLCLVFINPTARNVASSKNWKGLKAPWLATKQIWNFLTKCGLFDKTLNDEIQSKKPADWDYLFAEKVYSEVKNKSLYITNLAKCSQLDARHLDDHVYEAYKELFLQELDLVKPKRIFLFGNQISSILLDEKISVSTCRRKKFILKTKRNLFETFAIYYPVGNGFFNANKAIEDINLILKNVFSGNN